MLPCTVHFMRQAHRVSDIMTFERGRGLNHTEQSAWLTEEACVVRLHAHSAAGCVAVRREMLTRDRDFVW